MPDSLERQVKIKLTSEQRERFHQLTGLIYRYVKMPLVELAVLTMLAEAAGSETLPVTPSAIEPLTDHRQDSVSGDDPFTIELELTLDQKNQIRQLTGRNISFLQIALDNIVPVYEETWEDTNPIRVGRNIVVKHASKTYEASSTDRVVALPVDECSSQNVFGTGIHPATQLSLILLEKYLKPGDRVLDLGTGSGILAAAAAKLGAREVLALDIEPAAVAAAQLTVVVNDLTETVKVGRGSIESAAPPYEVVVANIFSSVILQLAPDLAYTVREAGVFISCGLVAARAQDVANAVCARGFRVEEQRSQDKWRGIAFRREKDNHARSSSIEEEAGSHVDRQ